MATIKDGSVVAFLNAGAGTCIDLTASDPKNGTAVIGYNYNGTNNQHWKLVEVPHSGISVFPVYCLINQATGTAIDLKGGDKSNGTQIQGWSSIKTEPNQMWRLIFAHDKPDVVAIRNVGTGSFIDLYNGNSANSVKICGWAGNPHVEQNTHQLWKVKVIS